MIKTDYGMKDLVTPFAGLLDKVFNMPYDWGTKHDVKNLVCYIMFRKFKPGVN